MNTTNIPTLKIHKLTDEQYARELAAGNIDENALYLTPNEDGFGGAAKEYIDSKIANTKTIAVWG